MSIACSRLLRVSLCSGVLIAVVALLPAAKTPVAKVTIQTVTFKTATLPATVVIGPALVSGLTYDVFTTAGACTQNPSAEPSYARQAFQIDIRDQPFTLDISNYGKYCIIVNAWDGGTMLPGTVYTTVNVTQSKK